MSTTSQASQRINALLDENSFVEIGALVTARATDFNLKQTETPSDGVITGYGVIDGNLVYVYSQDASVLNGTIGEMHAKKIVGLYDLAMKMSAPVIGLIDSAGLRLQEATDALNGFGEIYKKQVDASGGIAVSPAQFSRPSHTLFKSSAHSSNAVLSSLFAGSMETSSLICARISASAAVTSTMPASSLWNAAEEVSHLEISLPSIGNGYG